MQYMLISIVLCSILYLSLAEGWKNPFGQNQRIEVKGSNWRLDADAMRREGAAKFPIKPAKLIQLTEKVLDAELGTSDPSVLADNFVFQFPIIGPLSKQEFVKAFKSFQLKSFLPDLQCGICDIRIDPFEPNRVWFTSYSKSTHTVDTKIAGKATNKVIVMPPQSNALIFNEEGKVIKYVGGYPVDKEWGNTGGLGGAFGILYAIGKPLPFPEAKPWKASWQLKTFSFIGNLAQRFQK